MGGEANIGLGTLQCPGESDGAEGGEKLVERLQYLTEAAVNIAMGELETPLAIPETEDELTELSVALEMMRQDLLERMDHLQRSRDYVDSILQSIQESLIVVSPNGKIQTVNNATLRLLGYERWEMLDQPIGKILGDSHLIEKILRQGRSRISDQEERIETTYLAKDGRHIPVAFSSSTIYEQNGEVGRIVCVAQDITERKLLENQLMRAQRLEMAGRIAAQVAHDFNNLLGPLVAYPELIKAEIPADHPASSYCDTMLQAAKLMADINEDMMVLGRRGLFEEKPIDLNRLVDMAVSHLIDVPETLTIKLDLEPDLLPLNGSESQLLRVLNNLIFNARDAMRDNGELVIKTENVYLDTPLIRYNRIERGEYVLLSVSDTGCGIEPHIRDRIFDAFFTTKSRANRRGCGLGLSVVQAIVADHRGYVDLSSEVGKGSTFNVYFQANRKAEREGKVKAVAGGCRWVLVVDDDPLQREVLGRLLTRLGYRVDTVASGERAIEFVRANQVDLLILDMVMPDGIDGVETYERITEFRPGQKAIIVSGFAESEQVKKVQAMGAGAYVRKPVTLARLEEAVRQELERCD